MYSQPRHSTCSIKTIVCIAIIVFGFLAAGADPVAITGRVTNVSGGGLQDARVRLLGPGLQTASG
jgi:hypothetical protein